MAGLLAGLTPGSGSARDHRPARTGRQIIESDPEHFGTIRDRIHFTIADVPAFPMDDRLLANPSTWPATMEILGHKGVRRIYAWDGAIGSSLTSLHKRKSGTRLVMFYSKADTDDENIAWGPRYSWNAHGQLAERIYYEPEEGKRLLTHTYTYSRDGKLLGYSWRDDARNPEHRGSDSEYLSEFYDATGQLIAVAYEKKREGETVSLYSWNGESVPFDEFRMKSHVLYANAAR